MFQIFKTKNKKLLNNYRHRLICRDIFDHVTQMQDALKTQSNEYWKKKREMTRWKIEIKK